MIEQDTIKLLRECDAGVKMGSASIADVLDQVRSGTLKQYLTECKKEHEKLKDKIQALLEKYHDDGKPKFFTDYNIPTLSAEFRKKMREKRSFLSFSSLFFLRCML